MILRGRDSRVSCFGSRGFYIYLYRHGGAIYRADSFSLRYAGSNRVFFLKFLLNPAENGDSSLLTYYSCVLYAPAPGKQLRDTPLGE